MKTSTRTIGFTREKQKQFLLHLGSNLNIKNPSDWGNVTIKKVRELGGGNLLYINGGSLRKTLQRVFSDIEWKEDWFNTKRTTGFWHQRENLSRFLTKIGEELNVKNPNDWGNITKQQIIERGGASLLTAHGGSVRRILQSAFPDVQWNIDWFHNVPLKPKDFWTNKLHQKQYLDAFAKSNKILKQSDWGKITNRVLEIKGGSSILRMYGNSIIKMLRNVYPDMDWQREWFKMNAKYPKFYWEDKEHQKSFFENISLEYNLRKPEDWQKVSISLIKKRGGRPILLKYENSLSIALQNIYPGDWNSFSFYSTSNPQKVASKNVGNYFIW